MGGRGSSNPRGGGGSGKAGGGKSTTKALLKEVNELKFDRSSDGTMKASLSNGMSTEITYLHTPSGKPFYNVQMIKANGNYGSTQNFQTAARAQEYARKAFTDAIKKRFSL